MERDKLQEVIDSLNELKIGHRETAIIMAERFASIDLHLTRLNSSVANHATSINAFQRDLPLSLAQHAISCPLIGRVGTLESKRTAQDTRDEDNRRWMAMLKGPVGAVLTLMLGMLLILVLLNAPQILAKFHL